ncbi:MAG: tetraacyldisaccharide 4'-kinase [Candidatus Lindowbacteria bacterium]|nr:tetraacyldisaccharide 4'-kinase [Candidatus Lindowbacteria bacterium]
MTRYLFRSKILQVLSHPLSWIYEGALKMKPHQRAIKLHVPIISVGNIHSGGVGKTPLVIALVKTLHTLGWTPCVVSRGYKGRLSKQGARVDSTVTAKDVGDEPCEIHRACPDAGVFIGADRVLAAQRASAIGDIIILDDGFQHKKLARDIDMVVLPADSSSHEERLLPLGRLREPASALLRADAIIFIAEPQHEDQGEATLASWPIKGDSRIFCIQKNIGKIHAYKGTVEPVALLGRKVVAFSAIAQPERFLETLELAGAEVVDAVLKRDHASFTENDLKVISKLLRLHDNAIGVTTAKDAARLDHAPLPFSAAIVETEIQCDELADFIHKKLERLGYKPGLIGPKHIKRIK